MIRMSPRLLRLVPVVLALALTGCAGGWRNGTPPMGAGDGSLATGRPASGSANASMAASAPTADGAVFRFSGAANTVHLAGEFNAWSTSADPLTKGADGVWSITKKLAPGRYAYKFVIDGGTWKDDPTAKESVDDGFGGKNSIAVIGAGAAAAAAAPPPTAAPVATGDGVVFRYTGAANTVHLAGEFNAWSTSADPLAKGTDGSWTITKKLPAGRHPYKFVIDGTNWKEDPSARESVDDGFGGKNSIAVVGPSSSAAASAPAPVRAVTGKAKAPETTADGIRFTFAGSARSVALCGSFNGWAPAADPMTVQSDGTWTITKKLAAGRHAYKFLVDGSQWKMDDANTESEEDGFGGKNSVLVVK